MSLNKFETNISDAPLYGLTQSEKTTVLLRQLNYLHAHHLDNCKDYNRLCTSIFNRNIVDNIVDLPFFSVRAFKELELMSIHKGSIFKTMTSSGTSGQAVSKIFLDNETAALQSQVLTKLMREITGPTRLPMLIIDIPNIISKRDNFSARGAAVLGFSFFGKDTTYALNEDSELNYEKIEAFFERYKGQKVFIFGFTFMVWKYFLNEIKNLKVNIDVSGSVLLHGGGWKKLKDEAVSAEDFKRRAKDLLGLKKVINYYGLVEQTGSLFFECEFGFFHPSVYSEVITRCPKSFKEQEIGVEGLVQVLSAIPKSYPGHSLITDDLGTIHGCDDCECGRNGKYFSLNGRLKMAEVRGCSDAVR